MQREEMQRELPGLLPFWRELSAEEQTALRDSARLLRFRKSERIARAEEQCLGTLVVLKGQIRAYMVSDEGREITLYRLYERELCVMSASCLLEGISFDLMMDAVTDTEALLLPVQAMNPILRQNPRMERHLTRLVNERFSEVMWMMRQILFFSADRRVAVFLWDELAKGRTELLYYTHDEIARLIGSAREVVSRMLKYFAMEGIVELGRGSIRIVDREKLRGYL
ncbi:Crp/Fnr family transcriptional regulator [Oribacterium sp. oral taxon 102]|uniref:Crp/Fnr family transcriptional regulator n=1 Tax=Oribacterium sp. oral taxon 102 TaxID=671214 RepID=UPI0015BAA820|nr:Crp/Fnr family transcriptional regulator [Oribacterium sp. oral taxon 102]NWO21540.1 Crp/Fnr family transcriptional regulator [Oribacterium sp. oral taxon 102]